MSLSSLLASAHPLVAGHLEATESLPDSHPARVLFFSLCDGSSRAWVCHAAGADLAEAWKNGVVQCQRLAQTRKLDVRWLRIDWVTAVAPASRAELDKSFRSTKRNYFRFGLAFDSRFKHAFLEQELNANAILYPGSEVAHTQFNARNFPVYAARRFGNAFQADLSADAPLWRFATEGLFLAADDTLAGLPGGGAPQRLTAPVAGSGWKTPATLDSGRRAIPELDADSVYALVKSSADFLAGQVKKNGQFIYGHFPCFGREIPTYNSLRHASSVYSMVEAWELTRDDTLLAAIRRGLAYLTGTLIRRYPQANGVTLAYNVDIGGEIKLGANAVSLLALVKYDELTGDTRHRALMEELALGIARMQDPDNGSFVHVLNAEDLTLKEAFRIVYYDGEAAFGLMRLYGLTGDPRWLAIVERAFNHFIGAKHWKHHDHWLSYCANELTLHKPEEKYFRFGVQNIAGYLNFIQTRETTFPTLLELSMAFHKMLGRLDQLPGMRHVLEGLDIDRFYRALHHRAHYLLNGFFWPEFAMYFAKPSTIAGSFFIRHHSFRVRIDDVEHYLSGYVAYWKMLRDGRKTPEGAGSAAGTSAGISVEPSAGAAAAAPAEAAVDNAAGATTEASPAERPAEYAGIAAAASPSTRPHVVWGGDVNLGRRQHYRSAEIGVDHVLDVPALKNADLSIINLECVVTHKGEQGVPKGEGGPFYYRARPEMLRVLTAANIDIVSTANNHGGDYGPEALLDQGRWLDAVGIGHAGSGKTFLDALKPVYRRAGDLNVAVFSLDATMPRFGATDKRPGIAYLPISDPQRWLTQLAPLIATARKFAHVVLVAVHWGPNGAAEPGPAEKAVGRALIDAGADAVLGASAHVLQGIELHLGRPIIHDAGDLLFDSVRDDLGEGGVFRLELSADGVESVAFVPVGIGFGFSRQLVGEAAVAASRRYAEKCAALGSHMAVQESGEGLIRLSPPSRPHTRAMPAPQTRYRLDALDAADGNENPAWRVTEVPEDARMSPVRLGPLTLLGARVSPPRIAKREMLWVETFWKTDEALNEDLRLDIQAVPLQPTRMPPWGRGMDHDPCDWNLPTSRWKSGVIYRDFYGLRPPYLKNWENIDLQLTVNIISAGIPAQPVPLPFVVQLAVPGKEQTSAAAATAVHTYRTEFPDIIHACRPGQTWTAGQLEAVTGGKWLVRPPEGWFVRSVVRGSSHISLLPAPTLYAASDFATLAHHEQYSDPGERGRHNWDSHDELRRLQARLAGAIVSRPVQGLAADFPLLQVQDPIKALVDLGTASRKRLDGRLVAITGSSGKTTTTGMFRSVFDRLGSVFSTYDNYNSRVGMMLNMASVPRETELVVLEVSGSALTARANGYIRMLRPDIAIITSIAASHLKPGMSVRDIAIRKAAIFKGMQAGGTAIVCRDIENYDLVTEQAAIAGLRLISYGEHPDADIALRVYDLDAMWIEARVFGQTFCYTLGIPGRHNAINSLSCLAVAHELGIGLESLRAGLLRTSPEKGRGMTHRLTIENRDVCLIDESYNANPGSMAAALGTFAAMQVPGRKVVVLGDMLELGDDAEKHHDALLPAIDACAPATIYLVGELMARLALPLRDKGHVCHTRDTVTPLIKDLPRELENGDTVLLKASNGMQLHMLVKNLLTPSNRPRPPSFSSPHGSHEAPAGADRVVVAIVSDGRVLRILLSEGGELNCVPASTIKLLSSMVAVQWAEAESMCLGETIQVLPGDATSGSGNNLKPGDVLTLHDLLVDMLLPSSNIAATVVARVIGTRILAHEGRLSCTVSEAVARFVEEMNSTATRLGLTHSVFVNPHGLTARNQSTPNDMMKIAAAFAHDEILSRIWSMGSYEIRISGPNARTITIESTVTSLSNNEPGLVGGKTGTLERGNWNNLICEYRAPDGARVCVCVFGAASESSRFDDARNRFLAAMKNPVRPPTELMESAGPVH
ncbi:CapA family protein [Alcaligenaceae bacterium]|nr:CapA family protein [Alcaligenaceae bacterium]